ncbi:MAG: hypothetical protein HC869_13240, partial [Rhodospirillales bacterium]|nr:hypothetical protein [Rhodospirillales bacterium]
MKGRNKIFCRASSASPLPLPAVLDQLQITGKNEREHARLRFGRRPEEGRREAHTGQHHQLHFAFLCILDDFDL